ncbi:MAG: hypothetical protein ACYC7F_06830, partial [Gemmatimonadaceae bacterium]
GILPLHVERIKLLRDARERLLTGDARLVAVRDRLWASPARHPVAMRDDLETVTAGGAGVVLDALRVRLLDTSRRGDFEPDELLLPGAPLGDIDLATVTDPRFEGIARWTVAAPLVAEGFVLWFDAELAGGERFSTRPGPEQTVHGCLYLPLREPLAVPARADLSLRFVGVPVAGDYVWTWEAAFGATDHASATRTPRQSSLGGLTLSPSRIAVMSELHRPFLGGEGQRVRATVALVDGIRTSGAIAAELAANPTLDFSTEVDAFDWMQRVLPMLASATPPRG